MDIQTYKSSTKWLRNGLERILAIGFICMLCFYFHVKYYITLNLIPLHINFAVVFVYYSVNSYPDLHTRFKYTWKIWNLKKINRTSSYRNCFMRCVKTAFSNSSVFIVVHVHVVYSVLSFKTLLFFVAFRIQINSP